MRRERRSSEVKSVLDELSRIVKVRDATLKVSYEVLKLERWQLSIENLDAEVSLALLEVLDKHVRALSCLESPQEVHLLSVAQVL